MEKALALGADHVINHYQQKISEEVRKLTNKEGVDIVDRARRRSDLGRKHEVSEARRAHS